MRNAAAKRSILFIIILALTFSFFAGCSKKGTPDAKGTKSGTRIITDGLGREVEIPSTIERIVPLANTPRMIAYLGLADKVVGISGFNPDTVSPVKAYEYANKDLWGSLPVVGTDAGGSTDYYPEQIISVNPDVILCTYTTELANEIQTKTGIPVVAVQLGTLFGEDYEESLRILADVCNVKDRAEELISYINANLEDLGARTAGIPDSDKPTVLGAAATFKGANGIDCVYSEYAVFNAIAANDVTEGIFDKSGTIMIDKEQVIGWDPQYIFLDSEGVHIVKNDYLENRGFYAQLSAVNQSNLYQYPSTTSYYTNVEIPIVNSYFVAKILYPEQFSDISFEEKANEVFEFFLGVKDYLGELKEYGAGYEKVILGDG